MAAAGPQVGFEPARKLLTNLTLGEVVAEQDEQANGNARPTLVTLDLTATVGDAMRTLSQHRITCAPVIDPSCGEYCGMVDVKDLLKGMLQAVYPELLDESYVGSHRTLANSELQAIGTDYCGQRIDGLLHDGDLWYRGDTGSSLMEVCTEGFRLTRPPKVHAPRHHLRVHHRIGVFDIQPGRQTPDGPIPEWRVTNVISQSDVVALLAKRAAELGPSLDKGVAELGLGTDAPACIAGDVPALTAFARMHREGLSCLGITEGEEAGAASGGAPAGGGGGGLAGTISVATLRGLTPERFGSLALPVAEFVAVAAAGPQAWGGVLFGKHPPGVDKKDWQMALREVPMECCAPGTPLREVLSRLAASRLHRCWVTDSGQRGGKPLGVITLTDVLRKIIE